MADYFLDIEAGCSDDDCDELSWPLTPIGSLIDDSTPIIFGTPPVTPLTGETPIPEEYQPQVAADPPARGWRLEAKHLFLTYPQCPTSRQRVLEQAKQKFAADLNWIVIAQEKHEDGAPHLHVCIALKTKYRSRVSSDLDCIAQNGQITYHGNYQAMRNIRNSLQYVTKEDTEYLQWGIDVATTVAKKNGKAAFMAHMVTSGSTISELIEEDSGFMLQHHTKVLSFKKLLETQELQRRKTSKVSFIMESGGLAGAQILQWLQDNIKQEREFKQRQLYIWSGPNKGKTSLIRNLQEHLKIYWAPLDSSNDDLYEDGCYDLIVFDEFHGQRQLTWLNYFLQGGDMVIHRRYNDTMKRENLPVIILSNFPPEQAYSKCTPERLEPLLARLHVIQLTEFISIKVTAADQ